MFASGIVLKNAARYPIVADNTGTAELLEIAGPLISINLRM